jgi:regulatory protein
MTITAIKQQIKNPNRTSIYVDGKYSFSLDLNQLLEYKIKIGLELNETDIKKFTKLSKEGKLKSRALEWLLSRPHSKNEFSDYLMRKKIDHDLINLWSEEFAQKKYLNDEIFAKWWVTLRRDTKNSSYRKLQLELRQKGIDSEIIQSVLEHSEEDERLALKKMIAKKSKLPKFQRDQKKLIAYLVGQGFKYSDITHTLNDPESVNV